MSPEIMPMVVYPLNQGYVNSLTPTIHGTGQPGATIQARIDDMNFTTVVSAKGTWSFFVGQALTERQCYDLAITQTNPQGLSQLAPTVSFCTDTKCLGCLSVTGPMDGQFVNTVAPLLTGTGKEGAVVELVLDTTRYFTLVKGDGTWQIPVDKPLSQGMHTVQAVQKDMGNESPEALVRFNVDTMAPTQPVIMQPPDLGYTGVANPVIQGMGEADATVQVTVDSREYAAKVNPAGVWNVEISEPLTDDMHIIAAKQKDPAGNLSPEAVSLFTVSTHAPGVPFVVSPVAGRELSSAPLHVSGTGDLDHRIEVNLYGVIYPAPVRSDGTWEVDIPGPLPDGVHTVNIFQVNPAGHVSKNATMTVKVDTTVPLIPVVIYPENEGYVNAMPFTVMGTGEPDAVLNMKVAGKDFTAKVQPDGSWSIPMTEPLTDGQAYSIMTYQVDAAGNTSPQLRVKFKVDLYGLKAPSVTFPVNDALINYALPTLTGTGLAGAAIHCSMGNTIHTTVVGADGLWALPITQPLSEGSRSLRVSQIDKGNVSPESIVNFVVDTLPPAAPVIQHPTDQAIVHQENVTLHGMGEPFCTVCVRLDDQTYTSAVGADGYWTISPSPLASGRHVMRAELRDPAMNVGPAAWSSFTADMILASSVSVNGPVTGQVRYNPPGPDFTTSVIATVIFDHPVKFGDVTGTVFSNILTQNGAHPINYQGPNGNQGTIVAAVTWIDHIAPVIGIEPIGNFFSGDQVVTFEKTGPSGIKSAMLDGVPFSSGAVVSAEGSHAVQVIDGAGNVAKREFLIDRTPPVVMGASPDTTYHGDVYLTFYDEATGVKSATLNGKDVCSGITLTENGGYTLIVTDHGDNTVMVNFVIDK